MAYEEVSLHALRTHADLSVSVRSPLRGTASIVSLSNDVSNVHTLPEAHKCHDVR